MAHQEGSPFITHPSLPLPFEVGAAMDSNPPPPENLSSAEATLVPLVVPTIVNVADIVLLMPGARPLPDFELIRKLGAGAYGEVWLARGSGGFELALKFIKGEGNASAAELKALETMKDVRHAHLLSIFGTWVKNDYLIVAMERADRSLLDRLKEVTSQGEIGIPVKELLVYMRDAARGIDYLNGLGIQHRDIKPHNLFLAGNSVKVADFGLAKLLHSTMATASTRMTPAYSAPEFLNGQASKWSDQYCLAVSYVHLRCGRLPFDGTVMEIMAGHMSREPDLSLLPPEEHYAVSRALAKDPQERWPSCRAFVDALIKAQPVKKTLPPPTARPSTAGQTKPPALKTPQPVIRVSDSARMRQAALRQAMVAQPPPSSKKLSPPKPSEPQKLLGTKEKILIAISALMFLGGILATYQFITANAPEQRPTRPFVKPTAPAPTTTAP
jgi:serine/threonine-protein kinase